LIKDLLLAKQGEFPLARPRIPLRFKYRNALGVFLKNTSGMY